MTTTERGTLQIEFNENNQPIVIFKPVNGDIWMKKFELTQLFGVYNQTITSCIDLIYKNSAYRPEDTSEYHLYQSGNTIKYNMYKFNLQIIMALTFHLDSWQAKLLREWFIGMVLKGNSIIYYPLVDDGQNFRMN